MGGISDIAHPQALTPEIWRIRTPEEIIARKYEQLGGQTALGPVVSKEEGRVWFMNGSCICYNPDRRAAYEIHGAIYDKWRALGGLSFGTPCTNETSTPDGVGRYNHFNGFSASIYWTPATGANAIYGAIREKWAAMGWERSVLGYPVTDELGTPDGIGRYNHFQNGGSIYWTPQTGAHAIWGAIRQHWESMGWENSYLGYPTSDEEDFSEGGRANTFQHGGIYWWPDTGPIDLRDVVVHYTGLFCFGETDWDQGSDSDEPYVILSIVTPEVNSTVRSKVYSDVDGGEARPDLIELYRGKPYGMVIGTVLMENDFGNPDHYKETVKTIVNTTHEAGLIALNFIPIVGPVVSTLADTFITPLMPDLADAINDALDTGDDEIASGNVVLTGRQMVLLAARTQNSNHHGIGFKAETPLLSGDGASYKAYFGLVPA